MSMTARTVSRCATGVKRSGLLIRSIASATEPLTDQSDFGYLPIEGEEPSGSLARRSEASLYGSNRIGSVRLPTELQDVINGMIQDCDKERLRQDAVDLYKHLRMSSLDPREAAKQRAKASDPRPKKTAPPYNENVALAYAAGVMPSIYAATLQVFHEIQKRTAWQSIEEPGWQPNRLVDWGSGTASAAWAARFIWPDLRYYVGLDEARPMQAMSSRILDILRPALSTKLHQTNLMIDEAAELGKAREGDHQIAIAAFTLGDIRTPIDRKKLVERMWDSGAEMVVIIDRGTPAGFRLVADARAHLLQYAKNQCHILAPCPHEKACPLRFAADFCHFSQRLERPPYLRKTKHTSGGEEDSKFSYVVFRRGSRPANTSAEADLTSSTKIGPLSGFAAPGPPVYHPTIVQQDDTRQVFAQMQAIGEPVEDIPIDAGKASSAMRKEAFSWPRIVAPPLKRSGHVVFDVCAASGQIERFNIPKSQGKQQYNDARKAYWHDLFPHEPKNGSMIRERGVRKMNQVRTEYLDPVDDGFPEGLDLFPDQKN